MTQRVSGSDRATPILEHEGNILEVELVDQMRQVLDMGLEGVLAITRCLALPETHVVRHDHAVRLGERGNEVAIKITPCRLSVEANDGFTFPFVDVMHPKAAAFKITRRERPGPTKRLVFRDHAKSSLPSVRASMLHRRRWSAGRFQSR